MEVINNWILKYTLKMRKELQPESQNFFDPGAANSQSQ